MQETENIVFEGAEAAVARINLDGEPSAALCDAIKSGNADILDLQVVDAVTLDLRRGAHTCDNDRHASSSTSPPAPRCCPLEVLEEAQRDLLSLPGVGMSILEISHRSKPFDEIIEGCEADLRTLASIPTTTTCCSCRAAPACSSRWCR